MKLLLLFFLSDCLANAQVDVEDLEFKNNFLYLKDSNDKFTGHVIGKAGGYVQNGLKEGKWTYYFSKNKIHKIINYKNGKKNGLQKEFYENKNLKFVGKYIDGKETDYTSHTFQMLK